MLKIYYENTNQFPLRNIEKLLIDIENSCYDLVVLLEISWESNVSYLGKSVLSYIAEFAQSFIHYQNGRTLIFIRKSINSNQIETSIPDTIALAIQSKTKNSWMIVASYFPPHMAKHKSALTEPFNKIKLLLNQNKYRIWIGDFNIDMKHENGMPYETTRNSRVQAKIAKEYVDIFATNDLIEYNFNENCAKNVIDHVASNANNITVLKLEQQQKFVNSRSADKFHVILECNVEIE
ncbi:uncharacterized protein LOC116349510 [Contarinia nasturtii]|uniref:uncharacterized protein LOC116349510 n=1 Tax=Contarinia nasturtii TaxID=265458 RepID=UPI0012D48498|nr:uncharacterized protein LOC116349510 [Contarinia nasturtii]